MNTFLERLILEKEELLGKITKLTMFVANTENINKLSDSNVLLLQKQLQIMNRYLNILIIRIELNTK